MADSKEKGILPPYRIRSVRKFIHVRCLGVLDLRPCMDQAPPQCPFNNCAKPQ